MKTQQHKRQGTIALLLCLLMLPLLGLIAFSVDYGFLLYVQTDLQRAADQAAIAAVRDLLPDATGNQDVAQVRLTARDYVQRNIGASFSVPDSDIEIGRYDPDTVYTNFNILNSGTFDTVRVTVRREDLTNTSVSLYFARLFNRNSAGVVATATAVLQKARYIPPGVGILPMAVKRQTWNHVNDNGEFTIYGDGKIDDEFGHNVPGNWGTVDIGPSSNGTSDLKNQIENGISQSDLNALHGQGAIPSTQHIDSSQNPLTVNADPGFSAGMKNAIETQYGTTKLLPIYNMSNAGGGNNVSFEIIGWGVVSVVGSKFNGSKKTSLTVKKTSMYDAKLIPGDLGGGSSIEGAFTSPVLVQ